MKNGLIFVIELVYGMLFLVDAVVSLSADAILKAIGVWFLEPCPPD